MSFIKRGFLGINPLFYESRRFRGKINIKRPQLPHFLRKLALEVCKPQYPNKPNVWEVCRLNEVDPRKQEIHNPFEDILAKECLNWFKHSRMVAFIHLNPISMEYKLPVIQDLAFENMYIRRYGKKIVHKALVATNYEPCTSLFVSQNEMIFSESVKAQKLLDILKKAPQLILMAALVDGRLLSRNEFVEYAKLPSIDVLRSQVCGVLESVGSSVVQQLTMHQSALVRQLDQYVQIQQEGSITPNEPKTTSESE